MRILFSSYHNLLDASNGASISTRETALELVRRGWEVHMLSGGFFDPDEPTKRSVFKSLTTLKTRPQLEERRITIHGKETRYKLLKFSDEGVVSTVFLPDDELNALRPRRVLGRVNGDVFLKLFFQELEEFHPDVYATYGGYWAAEFALEGARRIGARTAFLLHNLSYNNSPLFSQFDALVVPSEFSKEHYSKELKIVPYVLPPLIDEEKTRTRRRTNRYLTFINPTPKKGFFFFLGIVRELNRLRPDIPVLVIENCGSLKYPSDLPEGAVKFYKAPQVAAPRAIYEETRVLVTPSLCRETFGRVVAESALNGVPVLCSDRGALPEILGTDELLSQLVLPIPRTFSIDRQTSASEKEVRPWVEMILKLWDDEEYARTIGERLQERCACYSHENVARKTDDFYRSLATGSYCGEKYD